MKINKITDDMQYHKIMMTKVLIDFYKEKKLINKIGFKGGTCAMFFYDLPRFSVDLDFDRLGKDNHQEILPLFEKILNKHGEIADQQDKFYTIYYELNYGFGTRNMKIEISKRGESGKFTPHNFMGETLLIMDESDLFTNKIFAFLKRKSITNRDIFDIWFFLQKGIPINKELLTKKVGYASKKYLGEVYDAIKKYNFQKILYGLGDLVNQEQKKFAKTKMQAQILGYLEMQNFIPK